MNLKSIFQKFLLWLINLLYYPNYFGFWSDNNTGGYCITNKTCTKYRFVGYKDWCVWDNNPGYLRIYNEYLEIVNHNHISFKTLWYLFKNDAKVQARIYFASNFLLLETASVFMWLAAKLFHWTPVSFWSLTFSTLILVSVFSLIDVVAKFLINRKSKE